MNGNIWKDREKLVWAIFVLTVVAVYLFALDVPLLGPDEPRYAQVAREMYSRGDFVTPTLGGFEWFEKPALLYWLQILSFSIFGVSEFAARFGSALFGFGTIASVYILARLTTLNVAREKTDSGSRAASGEGASADQSFSNSDFPGYAAMLMATSLGLMVFSRGASFDIVITFPITAAMAAFFVFESGRLRSDRGRYAALFLFYFFIGIGLLGKGLIGAVFPIAIVTFYFLLSRRWPSKPLFLSLLWGTVVVAAVAALWYLPMFIKHGWKFWDEFFVQHHFERFTSNKYKHPGPFWFFFAILPAMTIPWLPFFAGSVWTFFRRLVFRRKLKKGEPDFIESHTALSRFAFAWMLVPLVFFSFSGSKLPGYILPALPPAIILTALYLNDVVRKRRWRSAAVKIVSFATLGVVALTLSYLLPGFADEDSVKRLVDKANRSGYSKERILNMHMISHSAEFYGAGRLVREDKGTQWKFLGVAGVVNYMVKEKTERVLVFIPVEFENQLLESDRIRTKLVDKSTEIALFAVEISDTGDTL